MDDRAPRLLIVDDDAGLRELVGGFLGDHGFAVNTAASVAAMRREMERVSYDLIVLDVMMPGEDGLSALRQLRTNGGPPVIMLSAIGGEIDRIVGLELGADDYVPKPCNPRELLARVRAVLRRHGSNESDRPMLRFAGFTLDLEGWITTAPSGERVDLSDGELRLLKAFADRPRRVLGRDALLSVVRGDDSDVFDRAVDVAVSRLRRKLGAHGGADLIRTVRGEGYLLNAEVERTRG